MNNAADLAAAFALRPELAPFALLTGEKREGLRMLPPNNRFQIYQKILRP